MVNRADRSSSQHRVASGARSCSEWHRRRHRSENWRVERHFPRLTWQNWRSRSAIRCSSRAHPAPTCRFPPPSPEIGCSTGAVRGSMWPNARSRSPEACSRGAILCSRWQSADRRWRHRRMRSAIRRTKDQLDDARRARRAFERPNRCASWQVRSGSTRAAPERRRDGRRESPIARRSPSFQARQPPIVERQARTVERRTRNA